MIYRKWNIGFEDNFAAEKFAKELNSGVLLAKILLSKNIKTREEATAKYMRETPLSDPFLLKDMDKAVRRIWQGIKNEETIVVYGDYDVDGVCASATLYTYLESVGRHVYYKLPNRETEGYGLNSEVLYKLKQRGVDLVVTVDNGISAIEQIDFANSIGLDVIVTDHHLPKDKLPNAFAVIDPLRSDDISPAKNLAGVGVAFKLVCALEGAGCEEMLAEYSDFVSVGTVADMMKMSGENRTIVKYGVENLNECPKTGLARLLKVSGLENKKITEENIAYTIAPRINAAGRLADASKAMELLLCDDWETAEEMARRLDDENRRRQEIQNDIAEEITNEIKENRDLVNDSVIVVWGEEYHRGVIGIVASRLVESYSKPAIVFTRDGDYFKGSGRSVKGFNLHKALEKCSGLLLGYGGHELARGMSAREENLEKFRCEINNLAKNNPVLAKAGDLYVDCVLTLDEINTGSVSEIDKLRPFGGGNEQPLFAVMGVKITRVIPVTNGKHIRVKFTDGKNYFAGIMFNTALREFAYAPGDIVDICFYAGIFAADSGDMVSLKIKEIRPAGLSDSIIDDYDIYSVFKSGYTLTENEKLALRPTRSEVARVYRLLQREKINCDDLRPLFVKLKNINSGKIRTILDILLSANLIERKTNDYINYFAIVPTNGKKDLAAGKIMQSLS
jgi:single-stranded-DNA-specific exonuclease